MAYRSAQRALRQQPETIETSTEPSDQFLDISTEIHNNEIEREGPNLLQIPREIRERIYDFINDNIQKERSVFWNLDVCTGYEGLRFVCRKLYEETYHRIFSYLITNQQPTKLFTLPLNRQTFREIRMLTIEIDHNTSHTILMGFCRALHCLQLTVQELHILFVGRDCNGVQTRVHGCGNLTGWNNPNQSYQEPLLLNGQYLDVKRFDLYRQLSLMRQLRVLRVRNANMPLNQAMLLVNKPHLRALSVLCDPRTISRNYKTVPRPLLKGLLAIAHEPPAIKVLELTANAIVPASSTVIRLAPQLEHLTWIVPHFDFQSQAEAGLSYDFYEELGYLVHSLSWRAPSLSVLRLCISMRDTSGVSSNVSERDLSVMAADFCQYLPRFPKLEHLEIHYSDGKGFFRDGLIACLPSSLRRLYITDNTISPVQLQKQVWSRYFRPLSSTTEDCFGSNGTPKYCLDSDQECQVNVRISQDYDTANKVNIIVDEFGWVHYFGQGFLPQAYDSVPVILVCQRKFAKDADNDYLEEKGQFRGEERLRGDAINMDVARTGRLGCITYEYNHDGAESDEGDNLHPNTCEQAESETIGILRLSGKLLDRERHMHLRYEPSLEVTEGIRPLLVPDFKDLVEPSDGDTIAETARYSSHGNIHAAIYNIDEFAPKQFLVEENNKILTGCLGEHWYFGSENEATKVFESEAAAKIEFQRPRSMLDIVDFRCDGKCRWMSPEYRVDPIASFLAPVTPSDWQSKMYS